MQNQSKSRLKKTLTVLAMALAAASAHATVSDTTLGNTRTITENFDGGSNFSSGYADTIWNPDDYLRLGNGIPGGSKTASLTFATAAASTAILDFYYALYSGTTNAPATVTLDGYSWTLSPTSDIAAISLVNPGPASWLPSTHSTPLPVSLAAGTHTLTFSTGAGAMRTLKVDDVRITLSVPEPESYAMLLAGLGVLGAVARRRKQG